MAREKDIQSRIQHKHDIEANWNKALNFIPKIGEIIIYDSDEKYSYPRLKIGDGITDINSLEFLLDTQHILHNTDTLSELLEQMLIETINLYVCSEGEYSEDNIPTIAEPDKDTLYLIPQDEQGISYASWTYKNDSWEFVEVLTISLDETEGGIVAQEQEVIDMLISEDMLPALTDSTNFIFIDNNDTILSW